MLIYNITCLVTPQHSCDFLKWISAYGASALMQEPMLSHPRLMEVADPTNPDGSSYALQMHAEASVAQLRTWEQKALPALFSTWQPDWMRHLLYFTTIMQPLDLCS